MFVILTSKAMPKVKAENDMEMPVPKPTIEKADREFLVKHCGLTKEQVSELEELLPVFLVVRDDQQTTPPPAKALEQLARLDADLSRLRATLQEVLTGGSAADALMVATARLNITPASGWPGIVGQLSRAVAVASLGHQDPQRGRPEDKARLWLSDQCVERFRAWGLELTSGEMAPLSLTLKTLLKVAGEPAEEVRNLIRKSIKHICN